MGIETVVAIAAVAASAAGTYMSYSASQQQAKQSKFNAEAQSKALGMEQQRQAAETEQAQRRKIMEQRRFTAGQEAALSDTGFLSTTGSPLEILADTRTAQQREIVDMTYQNDTTNWQLGSRAQGALYEGASQANAIRGQAGGTLLSNAATTGQMAAKTYKMYKDSKAE